MSQLWIIQKNQYIQGGLWKNMPDNGIGVIPPKLVYDGYIPSIVKDPCYFYFEK